MWTWARRLGSWAFLNLVPWRFFDWWFERERRPQRLLKLKEEYARWAFQQKAKSERRMLDSIAERDEAARHEQEAYRQQLAAERKKLVAERKTAAVRDSAARQLAGLLHRTCDGRPSSIPPHVVVGGPRHGERYMCDQRQFRTDSLYMRMGMDVVFPPIHRDQYELTRICIGRSEIRIWLHESFADADFNEAARILGW
jgi:hypothetical protein